MKRLLTALVLCVGVVAAHAGDTCEAKAVDKSGKPLAGAAKNSFMKKCEHEATKGACETKAVDKNGKPLAGAAKNSFMKKCEHDSATASK